MCEGSTAALVPDCSTRITGHARLCAELCLTSLTSRTCMHVPQSLGLMEVRTVLVTLLSRFHFELDPQMGGAEEVGA